MNSENQETFFKFFIPILSPLCAIILLFLQRTYFPTAEQILPVNTFSLLINIFFLMLNLLEFILLVRQNYSRILCAVSTFSIVILAFEFNFRIGAIPSPFSDFVKFIIGYGGLWTGIILLESLYYFFIRRVVIKSETEHISAGHDGSLGGTNADGSPNGMPNNSGQIGRNKFTLLKKTDNARTLAISIFILYIMAVFLLPFMNWGNLKSSGWLNSIKEINLLIYGKLHATDNFSAEFLKYLLGLFVICIAVIVVSLYVIHLLTKFFSKNSNQNDFFEEYSTPIIILVVAGAFLLYIRKGPFGDLNIGGSSQGDHAGWNDIAGLINFIANLFSYIVCIIVAFISMLVAFETIRLVLNQCLKRGSLLKGSMQLIFVIIFQYTMGLIMGILRVFALRDVIESLLMFFIPDLDDTIEPEVKRVINIALRREVHQISQLTCTSSSYHEHQKLDKNKFIIRYKRRKSR